MPGVRAVLGLLAAVVALVAIWGPASLPALAADAPVAVAAGGPESADVAAIRNAAAAYRTALAKGDAAAIRGAWADGGDVVDGWGTLLSAADVADVGTAAAGAPRPEIRASETRVRLITPDVALEDGFVDVVMPGNKTALEGWFTAIWVKQGGAWKLAGVREAERPPVSGPDALGDLDWMVGEWTLVPDEPAPDALPAMSMSVRWDAGHRFLVRDVRLEAPASAAAAEKVTVDVQQRIGWDPLVGRIRSWSFASDGTRSEATWFRDGASWVSRTTTTPSDGIQSTTLHVYTYDGKDRCQWRTVQEPFDADVRGAPVRATWVRKPKGGGT